MSDSEDGSIPHGEPGSRDEPPCTSAAVAPDDLSMETMEDGQSSPRNTRVETGVSWFLLGTVLVGQLVFLGFFYWFASPSIRDEVFSSLAWSGADFGLGVAGGLGLLLLGTLLDMKDWQWVKNLERVTQDLTLQLFGNKRRLGTVTALSIPLGAFVGFVEECTFRGFLPLMIAGSTGWSTPVVVFLSSLIFGVLHAATLAYFISATVAGVIFHGLLLANGSLVAPVVAHGLYDALAFLKYHMKGTATQDGSS